MADIQFHSVNTMPLPFTISSCHESPLRLIGIACVGNEADIVEAFVRENLAFLDHMLILEHNSLDGTRDILNRLVDEGLPITVEYSREPVFRQRAFANKLLHDALGAGGADWIFSLDCDEFIVAESRSALDRILLSLEDSHAYLRWVTYAPHQDDPRDEAHPLKRIQHCFDYPAPAWEENPWVWKTIINVALLGDYHLDRYDLLQGSHFLALRGENKPANATARPVDELALAHFPARSSEQVSAKTALTMLAMQGLYSRDNFPIHYAALWRKIIQGGIDLDTLSSMAREYLDTGRHSGDALAGTPMKHAPFRVQSNLLYTRDSLPALATVLKWLERNQFSEQYLYVSHLRDTPPPQPTSDS